MVDLDGDGSFYDVDGVEGNTGANDPASFNKGKSMTANYLAETDFLLEAGAILRGETRKLATIEHLKALEQLIRGARSLLENANERLDTEDLTMADWFREAAKATR